VEAVTLALNVEAFIVCSACSVKQTSKMEAASGSGSRSFSIYRKLAGNPSHHAVVPGRYLFAWKRRHHCRNFANSRTTASLIYTDYLSRGEKKQTQSGSASLQGVHRVSTLERFHHVPNPIFDPPVVANFMLKRFSSCFVGSHSQINKYAVSRNVLLTLALQSGCHDIPVSPVAHRHG